MALRAKGKHAQADMVKNILPPGVECIFVRQPEQLGLGHAVLCTERVVGSDPFAVLLADDFLTFDGAGITRDLVGGFDRTGKTQLSVMEVSGPDISKYGVIVPGAQPGSVAGLVEKPSPQGAPSNLASIGRYVLTPDIFDILRKQPAGAGTWTQSCTSQIGVARRAPEWRWLWCVRPKSRRCALPNSGICAVRIGCATRRRALLRTY